MTEQSRESLEHERAMMTVTADKQQQTIAELRAALERIVFLVDTTGMTMTDRLNAIRRDAAGALAKVRP